MDYQEFFRQVIGTNQISPHEWQVALAQQPALGNRLIRIPTGFGKTLGVLTAWLWNRVHRQDQTWPRRLVWCLPMRTLVEQTDAEVRAALSRLGMLWPGKGDHSGQIGVHLLMGGAGAGDWHLFPEHCAVLIGTQDMLLSRALNRGYGSARARWPMDFGLLHQDSLWVMDEVQLMDVGLATSGQIQSFREDDRKSGKSPRVATTWWMSATLQRTWLEKSPETRAFGPSLSQTAIPPASRIGPLWEDISKPVRVESLKDANAIAALAAKEHLEAGRGKNGPTLVVVNTVRAAVAVRDAIVKKKELQGSDVRLVHSRFRPFERAQWREGFLNRDACARGIDRIIVATQVIEAGVDISSSVLITELAPWASLVQRFGRAARWDGSAQVVVADTAPKDDAAAAPYAKSELDCAREALANLADVSPQSLEAFEETHQEDLPALYPYAPKHLLLRHELDELFDITADLSGADIDVSRFIRSGEERDLQVFWQEIPNDSQPHTKLRPNREALCPVPFLSARDWLCGKETAGSKPARLKKDMRAWVWDWLEGSWRRAERRDFYPGQTVLVAANCGGYEPGVGWSPESRKAVEPLPEPDTTAEDLADSSQDGEALSASPWQTIAVHGAAVGRLAASIAAVVMPANATLLDLAGRWHDAGKVHEAFQNSIQGNDRPSRQDLAKAPNSAWLPVSRLYPDAEGRRRGGFRHELASTLALFATLQRHLPDHPALLGPWREFLESAQMPVPLWLPPAAPPTALEQEILSLSAHDFDLIAYLVCSHHGKVRLTWHAGPADQQAADTRLRIRGIRDGELLPPVVLSTSTNAYVELPASILDLSPAALGLNSHTGRGWTERVLGLLDRHGPFYLAWLEALLRAADQRASRELLADPLLGTGGSPI